MTKLHIAQDLFDMFYPIGSYYETSNTSWTPQSAGWYGTWIEDTKGKVLVALDAEQSEFNIVGKTGGSKYMQSHYHYSMQVDGNKVTWGGSGNELNMAAVGIPWTGNFNGGSKIITSNTGDGNSQNLQPYVVVRRWHRTA